MTFPEQVEHERQRMWRSGIPSAHDGLLLLMLKFVARPYLLWHDRVFLRFLGVYVPVVRWILGACTRDFRGDASGGPVLRLAIDLHNVVLSLLLIASYSIAYALCARSSAVAGADWGLLALCLFPAWRCYEMLMFIALLHSEVGYKPYALVRSLLNTLWHYLEVVVAFGVFYLTCAIHCGDRFTTDSQRDQLTDGFLNSAYFSFVTIATVGYGDLSPQTSIGKILAMMEVMYGLFLLVVVLQRAMSAGEAREG